MSKDGEAHPLDLLVIEPILIMAKVKWTKLKDNPDLKNEISTIVERLKFVNDDDSRRHLSDTGCSLRSIARDLKELSEKTFERHNEQKVV